MLRQLLPGEKLTHGADGLEYAPMRSRLRLEHGVDRMIERTVPQQHESPPLQPIRSRGPLIAFAGTFALLAVAFTASFLDAQRMANMASAVEATHRTLAQLNDVSLSVERAVTTVRVFMLSGAEDYVMPFADMKERIAEDLSQLRRAFAEDSEQSLRLADLDALVAERIQMSEQYIAVRRVKEVAEAVKEIPAGGEQLVGRIRDLIGQMEQAERLRLAQRQAAAATSNERTLIAVAFSGVTSLILLTAAFAALRRQVVRRAALEKELLAASEHERSRIGRDLHDGLGQELTGLSLGLEALGMSLEREQSAHVPVVHNLSTLARKAVLDASRMAHSLTAVSWSAVSLCNALRGLANDINTYSNVTCTVRCSAAADLRDPDVSAQLFRIAQEGTTNALKHGNPTEIEVHCWRERNRGFLAVRDNGTGVEPDALRNRGLGLRSMRYRAGAIGGTLTIRTNSQGGTELLCEFELPVTASGRAARD